MPLVFVFDLLPSEPTEPTYYYDEFYFCRLGNFYIIMPSVNRDIFISSFPTCMPPVSSLALLLWLELPGLC